MNTEFYVTLLYLGASVFLNRAETQSEREDNGVRHKGMLNKDQHCHNFLDGSIYTNESSFDD